MTVLPLLLFFFFFGIVYTAAVYTVSLTAPLNLKRDYTLEPTVTVQMSAFNEGEHVYRTIESLTKSNYPKSKMQIVAFDDKSQDDTFEWLLKAQRDFGGLVDVVVRRNEENQGKAHTLADAALLATGEILITTDSDCIFDEDAIKELVVCFANPKIGAVGGLIGISNLNESVLTQMQSMLYNMDNYLFKPMECLTLNVQCLGGPLVAFRRQLYLDIMPEMRENNFLGERVTIGEDRFITQRVLLKGYKTFVTLKSKCWVGTPVTWGNYFKQQLRWRRSAVGQWVHSAINMRDFVNKAGVVATAGSLFPIMANFVYLLYILYVISIGVALPFIATLMIIKMAFLPVFVLLYDHFIQKYDPRQKLKNPVLATTMMAIWSLTCVTIVVPWAIFTLDDGGWITRQNGSKGNS